ncbi:hypothetical protein MAMMFC1_01703 [Methylomusa anaerophila]|uniref:Uncharacterized protein n=1 Tax=Methylomusa anaerophila TaxID=1930071 RepID=A0A348AIY7_9FIRM|nr:hypothetical protein MAMMFC1_01703 [Methylomusa anaerophila]
MFSFLREKCNHSYCEYVVIDQYTKEDAQDVFYASNYGTSITKYQVEVRYCKHCGQTYKKYLAKS